MAMAEVVHIDASLIRANVSWESLTDRHVMDVLIETQNEYQIEAERRGLQSGKYKKICITDPDATTAMSARNRRLEPAYKQHTAVDHKLGVILDVAVTTGQTNEGDMIEPRVDGRGYYRDRDQDGHGRCRLCLREGLWRAGAPRHQRADPRQSRADQVPRAAPPLPVRRQERHFEVPARAILRPGRPIKHGRFFYSKAKDCARAHSSPTAYRRGELTRQSLSVTMIPHCSVPVAIASDGARRIGNSIRVIAGARGASTAKPTPGMVSHALYGAVSQT